MTLLEPIILIERKPDIRDFQDKKKMLQIVDHQNICESVIPEISKKKILILSINFN